MINKSSDVLWGEFDIVSHDPVPRENRVHCNEISFLWGLIKIKA